MFQLVFLLEIKQATSFLVRVQSHLQPRSCQLPPVVWKMSLLPLVSFLSQRRLQTRVVPSKMTQAW